MPEEMTLEELEAKVKELRAQKAAKAQRAALAAEGNAIIAELNAAKAEAKRVFDAKHRFLGPVLGGVETVARKAVAEAPGAAVSLAKAVNNQVDYGTAPKPRKGKKGRKREPPSMAARIADAYS